jgi:hypothetical protein
MVYKTKTNSSYITSTEEVIEQLLALRHASPNKIWHMRQAFQTMLHTIDEATESQFTNDLDVHVL